MAGREKRDKLWKQEQREGRGLIYHQKKERSLWNNIVKLLEKITHHSRVLYPVKTDFKTNGKIKTFSNIQRLKKSTHNSRNVTRIFVQGEEKEY